MKGSIAIVASCLLVLGAGWANPGLASDLLVTGEVLLWHSPNLVALLPGEDRDPVAARATAESAAPIGELAYDRYFESHGLPPPLGFLQPLVYAPDNLARLDQGAVVFPKTGARVALGNVALPPGSSPASPYLLSGAGQGWVLGRPTPGFAPLR